MYLVSIKNNFIAFQIEGRTQ